MTIRRIPLFFSLVVAIAGLLACSYVGTPPPVTPSTALPVDTPTSAPTSTPDPCSAEGLPAEVRSLDRLTRRFDDAAAIARNSKQDQLGPDIATLQTVRRDTEALEVPTCLDQLHDLQLVYMNTFIQTLLSFQGGANADEVTHGIAVAGQLHDQYMIAITRLVGRPASAPPSTAPLAPAEAGTETPAPSVPVITNPGPDTVRVFTRPALDAQSVGALAAGQSALALAQTGDGQWVMIEIPGWLDQTAWVEAAKVQYAGPGAPPIMAAP